TLLEVPQAATGTRVAAVTARTATRLCRSLRMPIWVPAAPLIPQSPASGHPPWPCLPSPPHLPLLACRKSIVVACSAPPLSVVPFAVMHLPCVIAWVSAPVCLVYLVWSFTVTAFCEVLPLASVVVTLMVLPATDATVPWTPCLFPDGADSLPCE